MAAVVENTCIVCGERHALQVDARKLDGWRAARRELGVHVQDYWTELTPAEREEFFISGICGACWSRLCEDGEEP